MIRALAALGISAGSRWTRIQWVNAGWLCVIAAIGLSLIGVYAIDLGTNDAPEAGSISPIAARQALFLAVGLIAAAMIAMPDHRLVGRLAWPIGVVVLALLVFLRLPGVPASVVPPHGGARAWINLGFAEYQPAETAKIAFVLIVARYLRFRESHRTLSGLVPIGLIAAVPIGLITLQPDLGTAILFVPALFAMLIAAGARLRHLAMIVLIAAAAAPAAYPLLLPHQKARIAALADQFRGSTEGAYDINYQSLTAQTLAGSGRLAGTSDGHARALIRYNHLPARHTDMILSVVMTRWGLLGGLGVLALYAVWLGGAIVAALAAIDPVGRLVAVGFAAFIAAQAVVNMGMDLGVLPIIGVTLPFMSYGGSSLLTAWMMTGLILGVALRRPAAPFKPAFEWEDE